MKKIALILFLTIFCASISCFAETKFEYYPLDITIKSILQAPTEEAEPSLIFPIDIKIIGISKDRKWYKFYVRYDLVFFGRYTYEGWVKADMSEYIKEGITPEVLSF
ncbi:hypothetical protein ACFLZ2_01525 [Candidatus Margulisiibacteriota bacterium]